MAFVQEARVEVERDGRVARVWMNRPALRNAFDAALIAELTRVTRELGEDPALRVIVLGGRGKVFSAGADLEWMRSMASFTREENERDSRRLAELFATLDASPKPVVARVHGAALGGGTGLVATADVAVAAEGTLFGFSEVRLGLIPSVISPYVVAKIGVSAARELFLTAERFDAQTALRVGLVRRVVAEAELDAAVEERVEALLASGPEAVAEAKRLIRDVADRPAEAVRDLTVERIAERRVSDEGQEGMRAFLDKRKPGWTA